MSFTTKITLPPGTDFFTLPAPATGYGARIFVRRGAITKSDRLGGNLHAFLKFAAIWGAADKEWFDNTSGEVFEGFELSYLKDLGGRSGSDIACEGASVILQAHGLHRGQYGG